MEGFVKSLSLADKLILMEIYPAREVPILGITSELLLEKISIKEKVLCSKNELLAEVGNTKTDILVTIGAGDIDQFVDPIKEIIIKNNA
jgi:UDP-N-acetylmuramate--alanine ligase